jgi:hypothetical protein
MARSSGFADNELHMARRQRRPEAGVALAIAAGLLGACVAQRVTAVDSLAGGPDGSADAIGDDTVGALDDGPDAGPAPQRCTTDAAVCTCSKGGGCNVGSSYYLYDNEYNCGGNGCGPESAYGCVNADNTVSYVVTSTQPKGNTTVLAYPSMQDNFNNNNPLLSSFQTITATFDETSPHVGSYEVAFDVWLNKQSNQIMIWVDVSARTPLGSQVTTTTLGGRTYAVYQTADGSQVTLVALQTFTSGTVDLLEIFKWAMGQNMLPATSTLGQIELGVEIVSTDDTDATFEFDGFSVDAR